MVRLATCKYSIMFYDDDCVQIYITALVTLIELSPRCIAPLNFLEKIIFDTSLLVELEHCGIGYTTVAPSTSFHLPICPSLSGILLM